MLNNDYVAVWTEKAANHASSGKTLLDIEVGGRLVEHIHVCLLDADNPNGEALELSSREKIDATIGDLIQFYDSVSERLPKEITFRSYLKHP